MNGGIVLSAAVAMALAGPAAAQDPIEAGTGRYLVPNPVVRMALVVGVENYDYMTKVDNALSDALGVHQALEGAGFQSVYLRNPDTGQLLAHVEKLAADARRPGAPGIVVFYFAGHGFQQGEFNFVVPRDVTEEEKFSSSLAVKNVLKTLAASGPGISVVFLDACRTTPNDAVPEGRPGFGTIDNTRNTLVSMAAQHGRPAHSRADRGDTRSPYSEALATYLRREDQELGDILRSVGYDVSTRTRGDQLPESFNALYTKFYFRPPLTWREKERSDWVAALGTGRMSCVEKYRDLYPDSAYIQNAQDWIAADGSGPSADGGVLCRDF